MAYGREFTHGSVSVRQIAGPRNSDFRRLFQKRYASSNEFKLPDS